MKYWIIFIVLLFIYFSCNRTMVRKDSLINSSKYIHWVDNYKYTTFCRCLRLGHNNSNFINELLEKETSIADFPLGLANYRYIDTLALNVKTKIVEDSIVYYNKWIKNSPNISNSMCVIQNCLIYSLIL